MIRLILRGGLGNQLFQISGGVFYAKKFGCNLLLDDSAIYNHRRISRRTWSKHLVIEKFLDFENVRWITDRERVINKVRESAFPRKISDEKDILLVSSIEKEITLYDWFQKKEIPEQLKFQFDSSVVPNLTKGVLNYCEKIKENAAIGGIHMRFGDFKNTKWGFLPISYYESALSRLVLEGVKEIHILSDDLKMARNITSKKVYNTKFLYPEKDMALQPQQLLWIMSNYANFVSSNSTLSWWGSYLNQNQKKNIFCNWGEDLSIDRWERIG